MTNNPVANLRALLATDMEAVDQLIQDSLTTREPLVNLVGHHIVNSGGKRLRPMLVLLAANALGCDAKTRQIMAVVIEYIHTATLLHDDVVDESMLRRGAETANAKWGDHASVLVGDFLYSRAFQLMVQLQDLRIMDIMADTTNVIAEGEVMQLVNCGDPDTTEERYYQVIESKTARLFEAATRSAAALAGADATTQDALGEYGLCLGRAYQLIDDVLDYSSNSEEMGKNLGDDLAEGKPTLPLIYVMREGNDEQKALVSNAIEHGGIDKIDEIRAAIDATGALQYTADRANAESEAAVNALNALPASDYKQAMIELAQFTVSRNY
ncbi:MAG: polyprenyl synthetase family protein [Gammaproteobacteria bacterium]|nr:polyprenyl synthetase family protein [Gammaproteobacteria bacterium]